MKSKKEEIFVDTKRIIDLYCRSKKIVDITKYFEFSLIPEIIALKINKLNSLESKDYVYNHPNDIICPTSIFYGKTKKETPILIILKSIEELFNKNPKIIKKIQKQNQEAYNYNILESIMKLTPEEFNKLEKGAYGPVHIIDYKTYHDSFQKYANLRDKERGLTIEEALSDKLLDALIPKENKESLLKQLLIISKEINKYNLYHNDNTNNKLEMLFLSEQPEQYRKMLIEEKDLKIITIRNLFLDAPYQRKTNINDLNYTGFCLGLQEYPQQFIINRGPDYTFECSIQRIHFRLNSYNLSNNYRKSFLITRTSPNTFKNFSLNIAVKNRGKPEKNVRQMIRAEKGKIEEDWEFATNYMKREHPHIFEEKSRW